MNTLYLASQDLCLDSAGNIAMATEPYALAQDAASACATVLGECYYDTSLGIDFFGLILGKMPPIELLRSLFINAAMTVPDVATAMVFFSSLKDRVISGQLQVTSSSGVTTAIAVNSRVVAYNRVLVNDYTRSLDTYILDGAALG